MLEHLSCTLFVEAAIVIPYISLGVTENVITQQVPPYDDGFSQPIHVPFPLGSHLESTVYVCYT